MLLYRLHSSEPAQVSYPNITFLGLHPDFTTHCRTALVRALASGTTMSPPATPAAPARSSIPTAAHAASDRKWSVDSQANSDAAPTPTADDGLRRPAPRRNLSRPDIHRKHSSSIIVSRDTPNIEIELNEEEYDEGDARTMSPRRTSEEIDRMGEDARQALMEQAKALQQTLSDIVEQVESIRTEHDKLESGNNFLQSYIGDLMAASKITSTSSTSKASKGKSRGLK